MLISLHGIFVFEKLVTVEVVCHFIILCIYLYLVYTKNSSHTVYHRGNMFFKLACTNTRLYTFPSFPPSFLEIIFLLVRPMTRSQVNNFVKSCHTAVFSLDTKCIPFNASTHSSSEQLLGSCHPVNKF